MKPGFLRVVTIGSAGILAGGCSLATNRPGLQSREAGALAALPIPGHDRSRIPSDSELRNLFRASMNPDLDGELAFAHRHRLLLALFQAGDERFTRLLAGESPEVIRRNLDVIVPSSLERQGIGCPQLVELAAD
ncbi:hypothetical protein [Luteolibacter marinus]|uniref:hypothetical protein n=1 Tax=Luteolibacter marinus TaxID=2776705 RepID=UPI001867BB23|nr:hypothetical protein [Luteolibacter marinus]